MQAVFDLILHLPNPDTAFFLGAKTFRDAFTLNSDLSHPTTIAALVYTPLVISSAFRHFHTSFRGYGKATRHAIQLLRFQTISGILTPFG